MSAESPPLLSLLIATRDRKEELLRTLRVMLPSMPQQHEIIVFDDGSADGTSEAAAQAYPAVRLVRRSVAGGYIAARNRLLADARGDFALSLDDDAEIVTQDFAARVFRHFAENPLCAALAFSIYWGKEFPPNAAPHREGAYRVKSFVGCGHVWRMEAWQSIPPYPEWFEFHGEEDYAALHLLKSGWEVHYLPEVVVHHRVDHETRRADRSQWRYRRQLRAGIALMLLFYPLRALPRRLAYSYWTQLRLRLLREHNFRALVSLGWVFLNIIWKLPRIVRERTPLTWREWEEWRQLAPAIIYWEPEKKG